MKALILYQKLMHPKSLDCWEKALKSQITKAQPGREQLADKVHESDHSTKRIQPFK